MVVANREQIKVTGKLMVKDEKSKCFIAKELVYISPCTNKFFLSRNTCTKLGIVIRYFPGIGATIVCCTIHEELKICDCVPRTP